MVGLRLDSERIKMEQDNLETELDNFKRRSLDYEKEDSEPRMNELKKDKRYHLKEMVKSFPGTAFESVLLNSIYALPLAGIVTAAEVALMGHKDLSLPFLGLGLVGGGLAACFTGVYAALNAVGPIGEQEIVTSREDFEYHYDKFRKVRNEIRALS